MKVERRRKRIYSFFFCRDASYLIQRCRKSSGMQRTCSICIPETHPILFKDSESRAECKELVQFAFPRRILSYPKMPKVERNAKNLLNLHSRDASSKDAESRAECKELAQFAFPRRILSYPKMPKVERRRKRIHSFFFCQDASYLIYSTFRLYILQYRRSTIDQSTISHNLCKYSARRFL